MYCINIIITLISNKCVLVILRGYIEAIREIERQLDTGIDKIKFDDIVVACGRFSIAAFSLFTFFLVTWL